MWLAHRRECGVAEAEGCVWNSDQWIDYANADQMYWLTTMFSVWMLLTNHSALVTHGKMSRRGGKGPILWPFPCCTPSVWHWMIVCCPKNSTHIYPSVLGLLQNCSLLAPCSFVALPQKNRSVHFPPSGATTMPLWHLCVDCSLEGHSKQQPTCFCHRKSWCTFPVVIN